MPDLGLSDKELDDGGDTIKIAVIGGVLAFLLVIVVIILVCVVR